MAAATYRPNAKLEMLVRDSRKKAKASKDLLRLPGTDTALGRRFLVVSSGRSERDFSG